MHKCNFSYLHYKQTLGEIKKTHQFSNFINCSNNDVLLRHDVDVSLPAALKIAKIEKTLGIESTFFILFHAELYNPFSKRSTNIIKEILHMDHNIGLHYNTSFIADNDLHHSKTIAKEIELMEQHYNTSINVVSAHDPEANKKLAIKLPKRVVNAYSPKYTSKRKYLSDSVQYWREGCFCKHFRNHKRLQVLIHPIWWTRQNQSRNEIMNSLLDGKNIEYKQEVFFLTKKYEKYIHKMMQK